MSSEVTAGPTLAAERPVARILSQRLARYLLALAVFVAVTGGVFTPIVFHPGDRVLGSFSDATGTIRTYDLIASEGKTPFTFHHDFFNGAPEGTPNLSQSAVAQPIQPAVIWALRPLVGTVAAVNLFLLAGIVLTALAMFVLLDWASLGFVPSLFGGLVIAFCPWMVERAIAGHIAFMHSWTLVLLLGVLAKLRLKRSLPFAALAGACYGLCFLFASYLGLLASTLVLGFAVADLIAQSSTGDRLWTCTLLSVIAAVTILALAPGLFTLAGDTSAVTSTLAHPVDALRLGGAKPADYLLPVARHPVWGGVARLRSKDFMHTIFHEQDVFVGYVVLALAISTVLRRRRRTAALTSVASNELARLATAAIPIAFIMSMPRTLTVLGVAIPMPSYVIGSVTTFYRIYARLGWIVELGLAVLAAIALHQLLQGSRRARALAVALVAVAALEFLPGTLSYTSMVNIPEYDRWLAAQPHGIVAHYPLMTDKDPAGRLALAEYNYQRLTRQPLYEIYSGDRRRTREDAIRLLSRDLDSPSSLGLLAAEGVRYVAVHRDVYRELGETPPRGHTGLRLLRTFGPVRVYRLDADPVDVTATLESQRAAIADLWGLKRLTVAFGRGFYPPERYQAYARSFQWMIQSGAIWITNPEPNPVVTWLEGVGFSNGINRSIGLVDAAGHTIASQDVATSLTDVKLGPFVVPPGTTGYTLGASPGPARLGGDDDRTTSVFLSQLGARRVPDLSHSLREP